jgi:predicted secreted protein
MSNAFAGVGAQLKRSETGSAPSYVAIAEINSFNLPEMSRETIDVTSLDSAGGYREFIPSFRDAGEVTFEANFTLDGYDLMKDDFESALHRHYQIVLPDTGSTTLEFIGFVTSLGGAVSTDDKVTMSTTIKISGSVTLDT